MRYLFAVTSGSPVCTFSVLKAHVDVRRSFAVQTYAYTVCPGSSDPAEKIFNIFASENEVTPFINYYHTSG